MQGQRGLETQYHPAVTAETPMGLALGWHWTNWGMAGAQHCYFVLTQGDSPQEKLHLFKVIQT